VLPSGGVVTRSSRLDLVDLAGSEKVSIAGSTGARLDEGIAINLSNLCLSNLIAALAVASTCGSGGSGQGRAPHIPYRDCKLTRLLQRSLGGSSKTALIATVSPRPSAVAESLRTVRFACRATYVTNEAAVNEDVDEDPEDADCEGEARRAPLLSPAEEAVIALAGGPDAPFFNRYVEVPTRTGGCRSSWYGYRIVSYRCQRG
jgi:kinesin family protein 14